ncbi:transglutaminase TgpA family protein [Sansalvadorimonas verongulae]|uniref:transglutaminase TgpA family protein n=1 Tax=Sansalvadorimonas verongulae TaxID=2172824 RepID=UPI0012BB68E5|nr:DUF3488 and transglutaminase-like domain-containing protein [Sansalvadorimonas verongulae]MTI12683.1 DUF3488 domain-containing protein [Sansalvadorimonas verongulae]
MFWKKNKTAPPPIPVTRAATFSLVVILVMVSLPLVPLLPPGILGLAAVAVIWRLALLRSRGSNPGWMIRTALVIAAVAMIVLHFGTLLGLEAGAATLVSAYTLKLLEMRSRRDALLLCFLGFFVAVTGLLFSQSIPMTVYLLACLVMLVSVLVGLHQSSEKTAIKPVFKMGFMMTLQALPLMVILFVLVPRIPPLWLVPLPDNSSKTGLNDEMAPGDIARLSQSAELAFRATFSGAVPPPNERYWRAVVMHWFDGRRWYQGTEDDWINAGVDPNKLVAWYSHDPTWSVPGEDEEDTLYNYDIILQPSGRPWLPVLGFATEAVDEAGLTRDWRLLAEDDVDLLFQYRMRSGQREGFDRELPYWLKRASLQLPKSGNPRARALAQELRERHGANVSGFVSDVLNRFRLQEYFYTLRPPLLEGNRIDNFLFDSKRGFCAHYAGALTFLLRAAGIPARVVAGYQGGELKDGKIIQVRQFDAHAWVEFWQPGYGWERVDPTAAVAPSRVVEGLESAIAFEGSFLEGAIFSPVRYREIGWINSLRLQYESLEYQWQRLVLSYDENSQKGLFNKLFPGQDTLMILTRLLVISILVVMIITAIVLVKPWKRRAPAADRYYLRFCRKMAKKGAPRLTGEGPQEYARRLSREKSEFARQAMEVSALYIRLVYGKPGTGDLRKLKQLC